MKYRRVICSSRKWSRMPCATVSGKLTPVDPDERFDLSLEQGENRCPDCCRYDLYPHRNSDTRIECMNCGSLFCADRLA